jgi:8-oxo-dGTP diphosphatase
MIRAAGAILWREKRPFELELALVHRAKFDDWTFPKGKIEDGESAIQAARREVLEETGIDAVFGPYLGFIEYEVDDEKKKVQFWMAKVPDQVPEFVPNEEVDRLEWVNMKQARHFLTYDVERDMLKYFRDSERHGNVMIFLRHAKAVKRTEWSGDDSDRPLISEGQIMAKKLVKHLEMYDINEIHTSDAYRCMSTVEPFHEEHGTIKVVTDKLSEYAFQKDELLAASYVKQLAKFGGNYLICSHNPILPLMVDHLVKYPEDFELDKELHPGDAWIVHHRGGKVFAVNFLKAPTV